MAEIKTMETMFPAEDRQEAEEVMRFLEELNTDEKRRLMLFLQGVRFAKGMEHKEAI